MRRGRGWYDLLIFWYLEPGLPCRMCKENESACYVYFFVSFGTRLGITCLFGERLNFRCLAYYGNWITMKRVQFLIREPRTAVERRIQLPR